MSLMACIGAGVRRARFGPGILLLVLSVHAQAGVAVVDDVGNRVALDAPAMRIVSLAPHVTELLFAAGAGAHVVGVVDYSDYPPAAREIQHVGSALQLDLEAIVALQPDLVIAWASGTPVAGLEQVVRLGMPLFLSEPRDLDDIPATLRRIGVLAATEADAERAARRFETRLQRLRARNAGKAPVLLFYQIWDRPLMTVGGSHMISAVLELCGGENVFAALAELAPRVSEETVLAADPEAIIAGAPDGAAQSWLAAWSRFPQLAAVRGGNLLTADPDTLHRQTPRLLDGAEALCAALDRVRASR